MTDSPARTRAELLKDEGNALKARGDLEGAAASYGESLALLPDYLSAVYNLALCLRELGRSDEAEMHFRRACALDPKDADALLHLGSLLNERAQYADAARFLRQALQVSRDNPYLWFHLAQACQEIPGQAEEALDCLRECLRLAPDLAQAHYQLGFVYKKLGRLGEAVDSYTRSLALRPDAVEAHNDLANILQHEGRLDESVAHYREALRLAPDYAAAHNNLGIALVHKRDTGAAVVHFRRAIALTPGFSDAHFNLGNVLSLLGERQEALRCYEAAESIEPDHPAYRDALLFEMQQLCDWSRFDGLAAGRRRQGSDESAASSPLSLLSIESTRAEQLECARKFADLQSRAVARDRERTDFRFRRGPKPRLRVGYLSADFHEHATAYLTAEVFELHERARFEVFAYSYGPDDGSPMRARLRRGFDRFVDVASLSHADAASAIHADGVDILVDLKGYTQHARSEIMALRPAPIQVNYLGYPGTMGAAFVDYLIGDRVVTPLEHAADYSEKLVLLPGSYQANDRKRPVAATPPRDKLGLPGEAFVFCCFNQTYKILPAVFDSWMRILSVLPGSVLWLLEWSPWAVTNLRQEAGNRGIAPGRLIFGPKLPLQAHLARLTAADLFLDTFPYNAHTMASDALWAGLPVLTRAGDTFASRVAASLLTAVGMPELITASPADYEALALRLARSPGELGGLRAKLRQARASAPLFDTPRFVRNLEAAYERMWAIYCEGRPPTAICL